MFNTYTYICLHIYIDIINIYCIFYWLNEKLKNQCGHKRNFTNCQFTFLHIFRHGQSWEVCYDQRNIRRVHSGLTTYKTLSHVYIIFLA